VRTSTAVSVAGTGSLGVADGKPVLMRGGKAADWELRRSVARETTISLFRPKKGEGWLLAYDPRARAASL